MLSRFARVIITRTLGTMASAVPNVRLSNGHDMPILGLGTWKSKPGQVQASVKEALKVGYRHVDCAHIYQNEGEVGQALKETFDEGKVTRDEVFITSKLWCNAHSPADVKPALEKTLSNLGLQQLDLYLIHWPMALQPGENIFPRDESEELIWVDIDPLETWKAMEACVDAGLTKSIGVSNFNHEQLDRILANCRIKPVTNQVEVHPYFDNDTLIQYCLKHDVAITAYSPLGSADRPWASAEEPTLLEDPTLKDLANEHGKTPAQVVLRWVIQRGLIVIPKSVTPARIAENFNVFDFELSAEDMALFKDFHKNIRLVVPFAVRDGKRVMRDAHAPHFPFNIEY